MIDFLTTVPGLDFDRCWETRDSVIMDKVPVIFLGKSDLIISKRESGRAQDLADIEELMRTDE